MINGSFGITNGAFYQGEQTTASGSFKIEMKINKFDINQSFICGTFNIHNLTHQHDLLSTYFEGELMGLHQKFSEKGNDASQWAKFPKWNNDYVYNPELYNPYKSPYLYFRIKELFLLPDPVITTIPGASIDGYYYCCYYKKLDCFTGFYHYSKSCLQTIQHIVLVRSKNMFSQHYDFA